MSIKIGAKVRVIQGVLAGRTGQVTAMDLLPSGSIALVVFRKKFKFGDGISVVFLGELFGKDSRGKVGINLKKDADIMLMGQRGPVVLVANRDETSGNSAILPERHLVEIGTRSWTEDKI